MQRQEEVRWAIQAAATQRAALLLDRQKERNARELAMKIGRENMKKAEEDRQRYAYFCLIYLYILNKIVTTYSLLILIPKYIAPLNRMKSTCCWLAIDDPTIHKLM